MNTLMYTQTQTAVIDWNRKKKFMRAKLCDCRLQRAVENSKLLEYDTASATFMFTTFFTIFTFGSLPCDGKQFL